MGWQVLSLGYTDGCSEPLDISLPALPFFLKPHGGPCYSPRRSHYCAVHRTGDRPPETAQSGGESEEGWRPAPLGRVRGEGQAVAARLVQVRGPSPRTKQRERTCSQHSALLSNSGGDDHGTLHRM